MDWGMKNVGIHMDWGMKNLVVFVKGKYLCIAFFKLILAQGIQDLGCFATKCVFGMVTNGKG